MTIDTTVAAPKSGRNWLAITKGAIGIALGGSVFVLVILGKLPVSEYMETIVTPGLAFLGIVHIATR